MMLVVLTRSLHSSSPYISQSAAPKPDAAAESAVAAYTALCEELTLLKGVRGTQPLQQMCASVTAFAVATSSGCWHNILPLQHCETTRLYVPLTGGSVAY